MNKHCLALLALAAALACHAGSVTKSTPFGDDDGVEYVGDVADRVNLWPVAYWRDPAGSVLWPILSFTDDDVTLFPLYSQMKQSGNDGPWDRFEIAMISYLDFADDDYCVFPAYWGKDENGDGYQTLFPIYWNGAHYNSLYPLWYYGSDTNRWTFHTIGGLAGARKTEENYRASWMVPLWYEDSDGLFTTLLYGQTKTSRWLFPLWYKNEYAFVTPFYARGGDGKSSWWTVPWLLSWGNDSENRILLGLSGWETEKGKLDESWMFPLYSWNRDGSWMTPLGGRNVACGTTNTFWGPLVSTVSGRKTGFEVAFFGKHEKSVDFDEKILLIDSASLSPSVETGIETNKCRESEAYGMTRLVGKGFYAVDERKVFLHNFDRSVCGECCDWYGATNYTYTIRERWNRGNALLLDYEATRSVNFDLTTRKRIGVTEECEASFLLWLYEYERNREYARHRVLWKLWDYESDKGEVSLDAFPFFTYDTREDGYSKTSFLWRLFRCERDAKSNLSVDFLFLPVWR